MTDDDRREANGEGASLSWPTFHVDPPPVTLHDGLDNREAQSKSSGRSGAGPITRFDTAGFETTIACEVKDFDPGQYLDRKEARRMDRFTHFSVAAAREARGGRVGHLHLHQPAARRGQDHQAHRPAGRQPGLQLHLEPVGEHAELHPTDGDQLLAERQRQLDRGQRG